MSLLKLQIVFILIYSTFQTITQSDDISSDEINRAKHIKFCDLFKDDQDINSSCDLNYFNFTFYANFRQKRSIKYKNLKEITETLSSHSSCETKYMKVTRIELKKTNLKLTKLF